ncbi:MAG: hypothetical protein LH645_06755 [Actinomycetia bacterium]|nr:hypothetical protein [Actinomycetes bacterium]
MSRFSLRQAVAWVLIALNVAVISVILILADGVQDVGSAVLLASFVLPGGLLTLKLPNNFLAWLLLIIGTSWSAAFITPFEGGWVIPLGLMGTQLLLRFPNGSLLPSPWWKRFSTASFCYLIVLTFAVTTGGAVTEDGATNAFYLSWMNWAAALILLLPVVIGISVFSLVLRFRRATSVEREQIRWITWAAATIGVLYSVTLVASIRYDWGPEAPPLLSVLQTLAMLSFCLLPLSICVAVLKYRLYDIERIISRTTSYGVVTGLLAATYGVVVALITQLVPDSSSLAVAAATLAAAAAFRPLLRRVQAGVDRRFDRERYDAAQTVEQFASDLRQVVDPEVVIADLRSVVAHTLQPSIVKVWST